MCVLLLDWLKNFERILFFYLLKHRTVNTELREKGFEWRDGYGTRKKVGGKGRELSEMSGECRAARNNKQSSSYF